MKKLRFWLADKLIEMAVWIWPPMLEYIAKAAIDGIVLADSALSQSGEG